jgi:hypothetical protein
MPEGRSAAGAPYGAMGRPCLVSGPWYLVLAPGAWRLVTFVAL